MQHRPRIAPPNHTCPYRMVKNNLTIPETYLIFKLIYCYLPATLERGRPPLHIRARRYPEVKTWLAKASARGR